MGVRTSKLHLDLHWNIISILVLDACRELEGTACQLVLRVAVALSNQAAAQSACVKFTDKNEVGCQQF